MNHAFSLSYSPFHVIAGGAGHGMGKDAGYENYATPVEAFPTLLPPPAYNSTTLKGFAFVTHKTQRTVYTSVFLHANIRFLNASLNAAASSRALSDTG